MSQIPKPLCYDCNHPLEPGQERCPLCGAFVRVQGRDEKMQAELHKDRWSAPPDPSGRAKTISTASPAALAPTSNSVERSSRPPVAIGVEGRRGRMQKFDATIGVHVGEVNAAAAAAAMAAPANNRTLAGIPVQQTTGGAAPGTRTLAWQPLGVPGAPASSALPSRPAPREPTPDPSQALRIEALSVGADRTSQVPRPFRREPLGAQALGQAIRFSADVHMFSMALGLALGAVVLLLVWFLPDLVQPPFTIPLQLVATSSGLSLLGLIAAPLAGSLFLALAIAPLSDPLRAAIALPLGLVGLTSTLLFTSLSLPMDSAIVLAAALLMAVGSAVAHRFTGMPFVGHIVAASVPVALLVVALMGYALGRFPLVYAAALKPPLLLWSFLQPISLSLAILLWPIGRRR